MDSSYITKILKMYNSMNYYDPIQQDKVASYKRQRNE